MSFQRRNFIKLSSLSLLLSACGSGQIQGQIDGSLQSLSEEPTASFEQLLFSTQRLAPEFKASEVDLGTNLGNTYEDILPNPDLAAYRLTVGGLVKRPQSLSLAQIKALPYKSEIIRQVCVEGWSKIVQWGGLPMVELLKLVEPTPEVRYIFFRSLDGFTNNQGELYGYYETWDLASCIHPQTLLVYEHNGEPISQVRGAPLRLASPIKLGYKNIKFVQEIMLLKEMPQQVGYWEDQGYEWYGGL
ncbi:molybdopterin-dependent oxidoreductase [Candidatus Cyanaurora vandensis]|uniref:molybdopterin-dependent oxidoreductase n=1 Tax=Candidatus Cyanaurora vandensis TaxID=2714958 RepID=UPI00257C3D04|nr:molybdopterin-dependent oxidoreductase [Candidatus Cyanaurora vandensis]